MPPLAGRALMFLTWLDGRAEMFSARRYDSFRNDDGLADTIHRVIVTQRTLLGLAGTCGRQ